MPAFRFDNTYARELQGLYTPWQPARVPAPRLLFFNAALAAELGLDAAALQGQAGAELFAGNVVPEGAEPLAQAYAGHQFGGFSPRLGDGRALLLGEVIDTHGQRRDIALKGSGRTPFSRGGDGRAAVGPMLREVLVSEALHALGVPTTRSLAVAATGEWIEREQPLPGDVLDEAGRPTGPLWGRGRVSTTDQAQALENAVAERHATLCNGMEFAGLDQERRALVVQPAGLSWAWPQADQLVLGFALPAGAYATVVLDEILRTTEPERHADNEASALQS